MKRSELLEKAKRIICEKGHDESYWYFGGSYKTHAKCLVCELEQTKSFTLINLYDRSGGWVCKQCLPSYREALLLSFDFVQFIDDHSIEDAVVEYDVDSYILKTLYKKYKGKKDRK